MKTLNSAQRQNAFAKLVLLAVVSALGLSMTAESVEAAKPQYDYTPYYLVHVKHPERNTIFQTFKYWNKAKAQRKAAQINREYWVKVSPLLGKPFYRDAGTDYVGHQIAGMPDKILVKYIKIHIGKVELIRKQTAVVQRWHKQRVRPSAAPKEKAPLESAKDAVKSRKTRLRGTVRRRLR